MNEDNRKEIRISVRNLVEFVLRSGDIDNRRSASAQKDAMLAGGRIHRKIQKRMGSGMRSRRSRCSWRDVPTGSLRKTVFP